MKAVLLIALLASSGFLAADPSRHEKYVPHENDKYISLFEDYPLLPVDNPLIYPYRAIGRLKVYFHKDGNYVSAPCTAFLVAKDVVASSAHCKFPREHVTVDKFEFLLDPAVADAYSTPSTIAVDAEPIAISERGFAPTSSYDWMFLRLEGSRIGDRVGYFGVHAGIGNRLGFLEGFSPELKFHTGYRGKDPSGMSQVADINCEAGLSTDYIFDETFTSSPLNYTIAQFNIDSVIRPRYSKVCLSGYPRYNPQTKKVETYESARIHTSNCGIGAIYDNYMKTSCSVTQGNSGSPIYYNDRRTGTAVAVGIARGIHPIDDPEELAKQKFSLITHYNFASFIGVNRIPDYFDPRTGTQEVQVSDLSPEWEKGEPDEDR